MGRPLPPLLDRALDAASGRTVLHGLARERLDSAAPVRSIGAELLQRRVVRYTIEQERAGSTRTWTFLGKVYDSPAAAEAGFGALDWMRRQGFTRPERGVAVPECYGLVPELHMVLMEEVGGRSLKSLLKNGGAGPESMRLFAHGLLELHGSAERFGPPFLLEDHLARRCAGLCGELARTLPHLAVSIERILTEARRREALGADREFTLAHGDFHPGQVHIEEERVWILDLDPLHHGDPAYDLAMVLVVLARMAEGQGPRPRLDALRAAFLSAYFGHADPELAARVPLNAALIHLKRACKRFRWRSHPGWPEEVAREIERAVTYLEAQPLVPGREAPTELAALMDRR